MPNPVDRLQPQWFAVYTRYKREKIVARLLEEKGIDVYLPIQKLTRRYTRKIKTVELPLFSCYVFVKIDKKQYVPVLETEHVVKFIRFRSEMVPIPQEEIDIVRRVVGEGMKLEVAELGWYPGEEVEIARGQLTGLKGKLLSIEGKNRFLIQLEQMGYGLKMEVDAEMLVRENGIRYPVSGIRD